MRISDWSSDVCSSDLFMRLGSGQDGRQSAVLPRRSALLGESRHAFFLVLEGEGGMEYPALELDALGESRLVGPIHRLLGHHDHRPRQAGDLARRLLRLRQ